jgi:outer membrane protein assembly factor BamB
MMSSILTFFISLLILILFVSLSKAQTEIYSSLWTADHGWHVFDVCFSPDGNNVLAVEGTVSANSVKLFNAFDGNLIWQQTAAAKFGKYCPDMSKIIIAGASVLALNPSDGSQIWIANQPADCIDISPDGSKIVIGKEIDRSNGKVVMINSADGSKIWEGTTKDLLTILNSTPTVQK